MTYKKGNIILVGTCITPAIGYLLNVSHEFNENYLIKVFCTGRHHQYMSDLAVTDEELADASAIFYHTPGWADWGNDQAYAELIDRIPPHVSRLTFPYPVFTPLWPFHQGDSRNTQPKPPMRPDGSQVFYPYGDSIVLGFLRDGLSPGEVVQRYVNLDLAQLIDLDALLAKTIEIQEEKEQTTDVKILDFLVSNFRSRRVFNTMNHVGNASLIFMTDQMLAYLGLPPLPKCIHLRLRELVKPQVPIHPSIIRHFAIAWASAETRYEVDQHQMLTFEEYTYNYAAFR